jgi:hypothetical protein
MGGCFSVGFLLFDVYEVPLLWYLYCTVQQCSNISRMGSLGDILSSSQGCNIFIWRQWKELPNYLWCFKSQFDIEPHYIAVYIHRYPILRLNHLLYQRKSSSSSNRRNRRQYHRRSRQRQVTFCQESLLSRCQAHASNCPAHPRYVCVDCLSVSRALQRTLVPVLLIHRGMRLLTLRLCFYIE